MDIKQIIDILEAERDRLVKAISLLQAGEDGRKGRRAGRRRLSAAAKKRISDAQKKRWAQRKKNDST